MVQEAHKRLSEVAMQHVNTISQYIEDSNESGHDYYELIKSEPDSLQFRIGLRKFLFLVDINPKNSIYKIFFTTFEIKRSEEIHDTFRLQKLEDLNIEHKDDITYLVTDTSIILSRGSIANFGNRYFNLLSMHIYN